MITATAVGLPGLDRAAGRLREWRECPPKAVRELFGATPDPWQDQALEASVKHSRLALRACVGPGKSTVLAWLILIFLSTRPHPRIAATSITWENLRDNLWAECAVWMNRSDFLRRAFTWTQTRIFAVEHEETWWASARRWNRSASPEEQGKTLAGLHARYVMAVVDESGGMPDAVVSSAEGVLANAQAGCEARLVQAGNPTHLSGPLWRACHKDSKFWHVISVTGDPDRSGRAPRVSVKHASEMIAIYGRESAVVRAKVLGLFPHQATDALVSLAHVEDSYGRETAPDGSVLERGLRTLGLDVARFGGDLSKLVYRDGCFLERVDSWSGKDTEYTADRVAMAAREFKADEIRVDDIGVGGGIVDKLKARPDLQSRVVPVNVGVEPWKHGEDGNPLYANLKAQVNLEVAHLFRDGLISLDPSIRDLTLSQEATDIRYGFGRGGKVLQIESKDEYRKRHLGASPDAWDATVLAFGDFTPEKWAGLMEWMRGQAAAAPSPAEAAVVGLPSEDPATGLVRRA